MRRAVVILAVAALSLAPAAYASPPAVTAQASAAAGNAPLTITLAAAGEPAAVYHWDFGDGQTGDGQTVQHVYAAGAWTAVLTATNAAGEATRSEVRVRSYAIALSAARGTARYGKRLRFRGTIVPAVPGTPIALYRGDTESAVTKVRGGTFRFDARVKSPGPWTIRVPGASSNPVAIGVHPLLTTVIAGSGAVGQPLALHARLRPAAAGTLRIRIWRNGKELAPHEAGASASVKLDSSKLASYRAVVTAIPNDGWKAAAHVVRARVVLPSLELGSRGPSVRALEQRLHDLHYALERVDGLYASDTYEAVLAFQKVERLDRTGRVTPGLWRLLGRAGVPAARYPHGNHVEVDKTRQVLFVVRAGKVALVVHVSTGATGNTPVGLWHVYSKIAGWSWVLWYPNYFLRGFAIHGYPDVPAYPASHGCVRVPMWIATRLYADIPYGSAIYIYY